MRTMMLSAGELSPGPSKYAVRLESFPLPMYLHKAAGAAGVPPATPVIHVGDVLLFFTACVILGIEAWGDNAMYKFQQGKHRSMRRFEKAAEDRRTRLQEAEAVVVKPKVVTRGRGRARGKVSTREVAPPEESTVVEPVPTPATSLPFAPKFFPGFPTAGLHAVSRHPNFASEQVFWLVQGLFAVFAGSAATRTAGRLQCALVPSLAVSLPLPHSRQLSLLFCASTALTEWLTTKKVNNQPRILIQYPLYATYSQLVGEFLPQETAIKYLWTTLTGTRNSLKRKMKLKAERTESNCVVF